MSTITTALAPSFANDRAMALPNPRAPPVMKATPGVFGPVLYATSLDAGSTDPISEIMASLKLEFLEFPSFSAKTRSNF
jgi:hypothetical protein